jgi:hypothetical protein
MLHSLRRLTLGGLLLGEILLLANALGPAISIASPPGGLTQRQQVLEAMRQRPGDFWPRGQGHVVLALPGSREEEKSYLEPGGSFSPRVGSFGLSLLLLDDAGKPAASSDTLSLESLRQSFRWSPGAILPALQTLTEPYEINWKIQAANRWEGALQTKSRLDLLIRSVGPAGGSITSLCREKGDLEINERWKIHVTPAPLQILLGQEEGDWLQKRESPASWQGSDGWGFARICLEKGRDYQITVQDSVPKSQPPLSVNQTVSALEMKLPEPEFIDSLDSQVAHLLMSLTGRQTRPGEPTNYPLAWLRDGTYTLTALARAGQLEVARELARYFAENNFFGGFGPEADAPGLALWALEEVAGRLQDPAFDQWLWPHVCRKVALIDQMLKAQATIYHQPVFGPIVPAQWKDPELALLCDPAQNGLIVGRMDHHRPVLFVNAVSFRGLKSASALARRLGQPHQVEIWDTVASQLQKNWVTAFSNPSLENERTYISGLWPTGIAEPVRQPFQAALEKRWRQLHDPEGGFLKRPLWTYFDVAEAHQWLLLGEPDRTWQVVRWFWQHQTSPGLYTWWEGDGEENGFNLWEQVRGWVKPPHVTPHYWVASEMLLLQMDMLACVDPLSAKPAIIVGAGIPKSWLAQPIQVKNVSTCFGKVNWSWQEKELRVTIQGPRCEVRAGNAFGPGIHPKVEFVTTQLP